MIIFVLTLCLINTNKKLKKEQKKNEPVYGIIDPTEDTKEKDENNANEIKNKMIGTYKLKNGDKKIVLNEDDTCKLNINTFDDEININEDLCKYYINVNTNKELAKDITFNINYYYISINGHNETFVMDDGRGIYNRFYSEKDCKKQISIIENQDEYKSSLLKCDTSKSTQTLDIVDNSIISNNGAYIKQ